MNHDKHIFFDLDRTLWDFDNNARAAFQEIFIKHQLTDIIPDLEQFIRVFHKHNENLWKDYRLGKIKKEKLRIDRFVLTLNEFKLNDPELVTIINREYLNITPRKTHLMPYSHEILSYLQTKGYLLHIITNGFKEIQDQKMNYTDLRKYFKLIVTSESVGIPKPKTGIFEYALKSVNARKKESLMIGDDLEADILGAKKFGIDQVFLNTKGISHNEKVTYEIQSLKELMQIL
jgi:putative hydrolase of the HAD superfamily